MHGDPFRPKCGIHPGPGLFTPGVEYNIGGSRIIIWKEGIRMMGLEGFAQAVLEAVRDKAGEAFSAEVIRTRKNNGVTRTGIRAAIPDSIVGPVIYLDACYEGYREGKTGTGEAAEVVYCRILECMGGLDGIRLPEFRKWEAVEGGIYPMLINAGMNGELLETIPHRKFLDLAVAYYIRVDGPAGEDNWSGTALLHNSHMELLGQDEETLYRTALKNMRREGGPLIDDMDALLRDMAPEEIEQQEGGEDGRPHMYVLSNQGRAFGAAQLLDGDTLGKIGDRLGDDYIVLPSSVHESIILPLRTAPGYVELAAMVHDVNREQVDLQDRLSDHVYQYDREAGRLEIVA